MGAQPESLSRLMEALARLPGVGERTAERLAFHLTGCPEEEAMDLAYAIRDCRRNLRPCSTCYHVSETDPCAVCADARRDVTRVCVVEGSRDLLALERTGAWRGVYHVLGGRLAPLDGGGADDLTLDALEARVRDGVEEVVIATNPDLEGDGTALLVAERLQPHGVRVTRIARGLPAGGTIEHAGGAILAEAIEGRRDVEA